MGRRQVINKIRKLAEELDRRPSQQELWAYGVSPKDIRENFKSLSEAFEIAGVIKTRKQVAKERKKRGPVPRWNALPDGETKMDAETTRKWRQFSADLIANIFECEETSFHVHSARLVAHHIIPRRCGGAIFEYRNLVVLCDTAHKGQLSDLYWRTTDDIDLRSLPEYQLRRLSEGTLRDGLGEEANSFGPESEDDLVS